MEEDIETFIQEMPKAELHCHLGGSMRLDTMLELADNNNVRLPAANFDELRENVVFKNKPEKSLRSYLDCIHTCESVLVKADDFKRVAYEICQDAASENVKLFELRFGPTNYVSPTLKSYEIVEAALDGLKNAAKDFKMSTGLIICGIRTNIEAAKTAVELAVNYLDSGVVGFDLAGNEDGCPPKMFEEIIKPVLFNFVPVTIHAGESSTADSIAEALIYLNAARIGHAVSLRENPRILDYIDKMRIGIEVCPTSNIDTGVVSSVETHPLRLYYKRGIRFSINTDNRTVSATTLCKEYGLLAKHLGFGREELATIAKRGFKSAFIDSGTKERYLDVFDSWYCEKYKTLPRYRPCDAVGKCG